MDEPTSMIRNKSPMNTFVSDIFKVVRPTKISQIMQNIAKLHKMAISMLLNRKCASTPQVAASAIDNTKLIIMTFNIHKDAAEVKRLLPYGRKERRLNILFI